MHQDGWMTILAIALWVGVILTLLLPVLFIVW